MFTSYYFAVIFLSILLVSFVDFLSPSKTKFLNAGGSNIIKPTASPHPCPNPKHLQQCDPHYVVIPHYNPPSGSIFANSPSVTLFTNAFLQAVYTTDILREVFDVSQTTAQQYADFLRDYATYAFYEIGVENADEVAEFATRAIAPNFNVLTLPIMARAYCNVAAHLLFVIGDLHLDNAEALALSYAEAIADAAKVIMNSDPMSKFPAIADGFVNYFVSLGIFTQRNAHLIGYLIGIEWFVAAVNYRWM